MSRSGYSSGYNNTHGLWRNAVQRSIDGKRGQYMLRDLLAALDAMPNKVLTAESIVTVDGEFCALGALGHARGLDMKPLDSENWNAVAKAFRVAPALIREIAFNNDDEDEKDNYSGISRSDGERWRYIRSWVSRQIKAYGEVK